MKVHAEIEYETKEGGVHSDICPPNCSQKGLHDEEYREFLHTCLDEYLDKSNGTGGFYIKSESHFFDFNKGHLDIPQIVEEYAEVFMNDKYVGHISTIIQLLAIRVQLKEDPDYTEGCCIKWVNKEGVKVNIFIDKYGSLDPNPIGFFDKLDNHLYKLIGL